MNIEGTTVPLDSRLRGNDDFTGRLILNDGNVEHPSAPKGTVRAVAAKHQRRQSADCVEKLFFRRS
jgi:hypothetical protein